MGVIRLALITILGAVTYMVMQSLIDPYISGLSTPIKISIVTLLMFILISESDKVVR